jgi:hypothetical protein
MKPFVWLDPLTIQVKSCKVCSKVAIDDTIWVDYRNHNNLKTFEQLCLLKQIFDKTLENE